MTPMEAWRVISANMAELYKRRKTECYKGYTDADIEAEVIDKNVAYVDEYIKVAQRVVVM